MACRKIVADKHRRAVVMMLEGVSQYHALRQAGYSHYSARCPRLVFKHSWALRQALMEEQERRQHYLRPPPPRRKRYDRRTLALTSQTYCQREFQEASTAAGIREYDKSRRTAEAIATGKPMVPMRCSVCRGPLEGRDRWCPNCQRIEKL